MAALTTAEIRGRRIFVEQAKHSAQKRVDDAQKALLKAMRLLCEAERELEYLQGECPHPAKQEKDGAGAYQNATRVTCDVCGLDRLED